LSRYTANDIMFVIRLLMIFVLCLQLICDACMKVFMLNGRVNPTVGLMVKNFLLCYNKLFFQVPLATVKVHTIHDVANEVSSVYYPQLWSVKLQNCKVDDDWHLIISQMNPGIVVVTWLTSLD
jgi:hypothetical protein